MAMRHAAWVIQDLNNTDKHRLLQLAVMGTTTTTLGPFTPLDCKVENPNFYIQGPAGFEVGAKWAEFDVATVTGADPRVDVPIDIEATLVFGLIKVLVSFPVTARYVADVIATFRESWGTVPAVASPRVVKPSSTVPPRPRKPKGGRGRR